MVMLTLKSSRELAIEKIRERIDGLERELGRMPGFKRGTQFHADRVGELESFRRTMARLVNAK